MHGKYLFGSVATHQSYFIIGPMYRPYNNVSTAMLHCGEVVTKF